MAIPELRDMHMQPALEHAQALRDKHRPSAPHMPARSSASDTLTAREREIVSLMAGGLSNRQIAERLVITEGTAANHANSINNKLGLSNRAQVAAWVTENGLL